MAMGSWRSTRDDIKVRYVSTSGKRVLLVEGPDDVEALGVLLTNKHPGWDVQWALTYAGKKDSVTKILGEEPTWVGVVDRDDWSEDRIARETSALPNLWVLPRFCLECYLINPREIWSALPPVQQSKIVGGEGTLRSEIMVDFAKWLRHGALWHTANPMWTGLRDQGFVSDLLEVQNAQDDAVILTILERWHAFLLPTDFMTRFHQRLNNSRRHTEDAQLCLDIHGKMFFNQHVVTTLNALIRQNSADGWRRDLFNTLHVPPDFDTLWQKMGLT